MRSACSSLPTRASRACPGTLLTSNVDRDGALASGMDEGMEACYRELDALVAR